MTEEIKENELEIPLEDTFVLKDSEGDFIIKMTWATLNRCCKYAEEHIGEFNIYQMSSELQENLINLVVRETNNKGESVITDRCSKIKNDMDADTAVKLYTWVGEHINNFFIRRLVNAKNLTQNYQSVIEKRETFLKKQNETLNSNEEKKD